MTLQPKLSDLSIHKAPYSQKYLHCFKKLHIPHATQIDVTHGIASLEATYGS